MVMISEYETFITLKLLLHVIGLVRSALHLWSPISMHILRWLSLQIVAWRKYVGLTVLKGLIINDRQNKDHFVDNSRHCCFNN